MGPNGHFFPIHLVNLISITLSRCHIFAFRACTMNIIIRCAFNLDSFLLLKYVLFFKA